MADLEFSVEIAAEPRVVFAFFIPQRMPHWYGTEMKCSFQAQGGTAEFQPGQRVRITGKLRGREFSLSTEVTGYEWPRLLEWRFEDSYGVRGTQRWEIEKVESGARVRMRDSYDMPGRLGECIDWLLTRHAVARRDREALARLKRLVERP